MSERASNPGGGWFPRARALPCALLWALAAAGCHAPALRFDDDLSASFARLPGRATLEGGVLGRAGRDLVHGPERVWQDGLLVVSNGRNWIPILAAGAYAVAAESFEEREADYFRRHTFFGRGVQDGLGALGNGLTLYAGTLAWYFWASAREETASYEASKTVLSALTVTAVTTTALKVLIMDGRPDGGSRDFPSGHAAQAMTVAASLDELYGHGIGWPSYALAGLVGLQRLDTGKHDTGSVLFGLVLGYVVGKTAVRDHAPRIFGLDVGVVYDEEQAGFALSLSRSF